MVVITCVLLLPSRRIIAAPPSYQEECENTKADIVFFESKINIILLLRLKKPQRSVKNLCGIFYAINTLLTELLSILSKIVCSERLRRLSVLAVQNTRKYKNDYRNEIRCHVEQLFLCGVKPFDIRVAVI